MKNVTKIACMPMLLLCLVSFTPTHLFCAQTSSPALLPEQEIDRIVESGEKYVYVSKALQACIKALRADVDTATLSPQFIELSDYMLNGNSTAPLALAKVVIPECVTLLKKYPTIADHESKAKAVYDYQEALTSGDALIDIVLPTDQNNEHAKRTVFSALVVRDHIKIGALVIHHDGSLNALRVRGNSVFEGQVFIDGTLFVNNIQINGSSSGGGGIITGAQNVGVGQGSVFQSTSGTILNFKRLAQGSGISIADDGSEISFTATGGGGNVSTAVPFSTDNALIRVDLPSGIQNIQQSGVVLDDSNNITGVNTLSATTVTTSGGTAITGTTTINTSGSSTTTIGNAASSTTLAGPITLSSLSAGILETNGAGLVSSSATTQNAVQIGNASGSLTSLGVGTNGQLLIGATGAAPAFATLTSTGGTVTITPGANSLNIDTSGSQADSFPTDSGTAIPSGGALTIHGGSNMNTSGAGSTVTMNLDNSPSVSGSLTAGTGITSTTGNIVATAGQVNAGTTITAGTGLTVTSGGAAITGTTTINTSGSSTTTIGNGTSATTIAGSTTLSSLTQGVLEVSNTGFVSSTATTQNAVQIGNGTGGLASTNVGSDGQLLIGSSIGAPAFAPLTSTGGTIVITPGHNTLNIDTSGSQASSFPTDSGTAIPSGGALTIDGGSNMNTSGAGSTVTINLDNSPSVSGSLTAGTGLTATSGGATITGNVNMKLQSAVDFQDGTGTGAFVGIEAPATVASSYTLSLPATAPTALQVMQANATTPTNLQWYTPSGSITPAVSRIIYVATYGSDVTGNGSQTSPYASLSKAVTQANSISTVGTPVVISISPGVYFENNSGGPITVTAAGVSILGGSLNSVVIAPTSASNYLFATTQSMQLNNLSFTNALGLPGANGVTLSGTGNVTFNNVAFTSFNIGALCNSASGEYSFVNCYFITNTAGPNNIGLSVNNAIVACENCTIEGSTNFVSPAGVGVFVTGSSANVAFTGGICVASSNGFNISNGANVTMQSTTFRFNTNSITQATGAVLVLQSCTFEPSPGVPSVTEVQISDVGSVAKLSSCIFNGIPVAGTSTAVQVSNQANVFFADGQVNDYTTALIAGLPGDTSSTVFDASAVFLTNNTQDILQQGSSTLNFNVGTATSSKILISNPTNVNLAYFDQANQNTLTIGSENNVNTPL
ncbi:MAG: beta strand repeat-containing protein, partial [Candidatus Babeliales bacterium]